MQTILAIESSTHLGSICLAHEGRVLCRELTEPHRQAAELVPMIESLLEEAGIWYDALQGLATTIGPGSFTGLRMGLAIARTIAFAHPAIKLFPFTTLECLAAGYEGNTASFCATLKAGKGDVYVQEFYLENGRITALDEIVLGQPEIIPDRLLLGNTQELTAREGYAVPQLPHAQDILKAMDRITIPQGRTLKPLYIRPPDAKLPGNISISPSSCAQQSEG